MLCPSCVPSTDCHQSWNPGTGDVAADSIIDSHPGGWNSAMRNFSLQSKQAAPTAWEGEQKTCPPLCLPLSWACMVTLCGDPVAHPTDKPSWVSHQADLQPLLKCMCEGRGNWAVVNLMFLSNQVILCSQSLKGNSCFPAPLLRGHLPLCLLQLLGNRQWSLRRFTALQHFSKCCGGGQESRKMALC